MIQANCYDSGWVTALRISGDIKFIGIISLVVGSSADNSMPCLCKHETEPISLGSPIGRRLHSVSSFGSPAQAVEVLDVQLGAVQCAIIWLCCRASCRVQLWVSKCVRGFRYSRTANSGYKHVGIQLDPERGAEQHTAAMRRPTFKAAWASS